MTSFFDKLNEKLNGKAKLSAKATGADAVAETAEKKKEASVSEELEAEKLNIDVYQSPLEVVIYALAAGVDPNDFEVMLDEENDMLMIKGSRKRPVKQHKTDAAGKEVDGKYLQQECVWMPFSRRIILPVEVDVVRAEAIFKKGVLIVSLPVLDVAQGRKLKVVETLTAPDAPPTK